MEIYSPHHIKEPEQGHGQKTINLGELYFGGENEKIGTLLGSCIAITIWHPTLKIGGMCHFLLPGEPSKKNKVRIDGNLNGRYSDEAMAWLVNETLKHNTRINQYQAKIFGGSNMLSLSTLQDDQLIGNRNTEAAVNLLYNLGVPLLVAHVGETGPRRIIFDLSNGDVWVKHTPLQKNIP